MADVIVEGTVKAKKSYWNTDKTMIYSAFTVAVQQTFKGSTYTYIDIISQGGIVGDRAIEVYPGFNPEIASKGIFFVKIQSPHSSQLIQTIPFAGPQSHILYDNQGIISDPFLPIQSVNVILKQISLFTGSPYKQFIKPSIQDKQEKTLAASISSINPTNAAAGIGTVLTINGSGFGTSYSGSANVEFKNSDDGGSTWISALASNIVSWNDAQIQVKIPTKSGTGVVKVTAKDGTVANSSLALTINYNALNTTFNNNHYRFWLSNQDNMGGHTLTFNDAFGADPTSAVKRALQSWRCGSFVNFKIATNTSTVNTFSNDGINIIAFNDAALPAGALGVTYNYFASCANNQWYNDGFDMLFRVIPGAGWNFGPGATSGNKYDFETVVLHELGHAHQLGHVINNSYVMHYAVGTNTDKRTLSTVSDIAGGADIVDFSIANKPCGPQLMTKLNASNCELGLPPSADFSTNTIAGCSPLQVSFQDNSTSNPTLWAWDIDNNGTIDYTTKNPVHTYINSGNYSVKLTATNSNGSHSVIKNNAITVYNQPMAFGKGYYRICSGQTATLANSPSASGGTPPYIYSWSPINGLSNPAIANPTLLCTFPETRIYTLTVTDALGCSSIARDTIFPYLKLQINAGVDQSVCKGSIINLGGSPTASSGYPPYQYSWFPVTGMNNPTDANPTIIVNQSETYICTVTDINNCAVKDTIIISMNPPVSVQAGQDVKVCKGTLVTLGGNPTAQGGTAPITFQWTPSTGLTNPSSANPSLTVQQSASYICTVIDGKGCIKKDTISIIMNPELIVQSSPDQTICEGNTVLIGGNSIVNGGTPPYQYSWSPIQGLSSSIISQPLARPLSSTTYILTVTDAENCVKNDTINVKVDNIAKPTISVKGNTIICESDSVQLEIIGDYAEYEWSNGQKTKTIKVGKNGSFYSKCTASNGCFRVSDTVKVTVLPVPIVEVSGPKSVCINTSATYSVPKQNGIITEWSVTGGTIISGKNSESLIVQWASSNGRIAVVRKQTVCSAQSTVDIAVGELEKPIIALLDNIQPCIGNTVILKAPKGYAVYLWSNGSNKDTIHINNNGIFTVQVWDENDCTKKSDSFFVKFNEIPVKPNIIRIQDTLFASISNKYQWYKNQQILDGETKQFLKVLNSGAYQVYIQDTNLCGNISEEYAFDVSGISKNIVNNQGVTLYQSSENELYISHQFRLPVIITIIDALGRELIQNTYHDNEITLSIHGFVSGLYSLIFWDGSNISTSVFIKK